MRQLGKLEVSDPINAALCENLHCCIGRVVGPADVAALAVHVMINTALTGATFDVDGGEQFVY